jgi:hypothetical protein
VTETGCAIEQRALGLGAISDSQALLLAVIG